MNPPINYIQQTLCLIFKPQINASKTCFVDTNVGAIGEAWQQVQFFMRLSSYAWGHDLEGSHLGVENVMFQQLGLCGRFCEKKNSVDNFYVDVFSFWPADELFWTKRM